MKGLRFTHRRTLREAREEIRRMNESEKTVTRSICVGKKIVGRIGATKINEEWTLWYWVIPSYQNRGIGTAALTLFLAEFSHRPLFVEIKDWNRPSIALAKRCGFIEREHLIKYRLSR